MELTEVSRRIDEKIRLIETGRKALQKRAELKAQAVAYYEKEVAKRMVELRNGREIMWEGETIKDPPATLIDKIARGLCWKEKLETDQRDAEYRNAIVGLDCLQAEMNGYQSINRYMDERS